MIRLSTQSFVHRILLPFGYDLKPDRWIFIIGCYNSGTTLLASILRQHPLMGGLANEGAFLTDELPYPEKFGWPRMWIKCINKIKFDMSVDYTKKASIIKKNWSVWYPKDKQNLIEKSISNATRINFLNKYFENAYFIYIVRDGYAVATGIQRKANLKRWGNVYKNSEYPINMCAEQWKSTDDCVMNQLNVDKDIKMFTLKYEDFTDQPKVYLDKITEFLELPKIDERILNSRWNIHDMKSTISNMNPSSFKHLSRESLDIIEQVAGNVLDKYGYTRPDINL